MANHKALDIDNYQDCESDQSDKENFSQISALGTTSKHPKVIISLGFAYNSNISTPVEAIADTEAMTNVWGLDDYKKAGFDNRQLKPASAVVRTANGEKLDICGQFHAVVKGKSPDNENNITITINYVTKNVK